MEDPSSSWALEHFWQRRPDGVGLEGGPQPAAAATVPDTQSRYTTDFQV